MAHRGVENFTYTSSAEDILESESDAMGYDVASMTDGNPYSSEFAARAPRLCRARQRRRHGGLLRRAPGVADIEAETAVIEGVDRAMHRATLILAGRCRSASACGSRADIQHREPSRYTAAAS